jgi:hypothetical protein
MSNISTHRPRINWTNEYSERPYQDLSESPLLTLIRKELKISAKKNDFDKNVFFNYLKKYKSNRDEEQKIGKAGTIPF